MFTTATIIAIEGPDKVGKETQTGLLVEDLKSQGFNTLGIEVPLKSLVTFKLIYWMLANGSAKKFPTLFQIVQFVNKLVFQFRLFYYRRKFSFIVFDRWALSALVYGNVTGVNSYLVDMMYKVLLKPDITFILLGKSHRTQRPDDSYESDTALQIAVREQYESLAQGKGFHKIDCNSDRQNVHNEIMKRLEPYL